MTTIKHRRGTAAQWLAADPVLAAGEPGYEQDTGKSKIGDGTTKYSLLKYFLMQGDVTGSGGTGKQIELQKTSTYIQWRYVGDPTWTNLVLLEDLRGPAGATGPQGPAGTGGSGTGTGADGRQVELQNNTTSGYIQWRYSGDATWTNLVAISTLKGATGPSGSPGPTGPAGPSVELQNDAVNGYIQWRTVGAASWVNLIDTDLLKGAPGQDSSGSYATLLPGSVIVVKKNETTGVWPGRPTPRTDIIIEAQGSDPSPNWLLEDDRRYIPVVVS